MVVDNFNKVAFRYEEIIKKQATNYYGYVGVWDRNVMGSLHLSFNSMLSSLVLCQIPLLIENTFLKNTFAISKNRYI